MFIQPFEKGCYYWHHTFYYCHHFASGITLFVAWTPTKYCALGALNVQLRHSASISCSSFDLLGVECGKTRMKLTKNGAKHSASTQSNI